MNSSTVIPVIAAIAAPLGAYFLAARRFSGKIETSDAEQLWRESRSIRNWSARRIEELNRVVSGLEDKIREIEVHNGDLISLNTRLARELEECRESRTI